MSELGPEHNPHRDAKAQAKAAKAYAKATRPWYKKKRFMIPVAGIVLIAVSQGLSGGEEPVETAAAADVDSSESQETSDSQESSASDESDEAADAAEEDSAEAGLNEPVRDGKFEFTVKSVDCGKKRVGSSMFGEKAQGQFCFVHVKVKNIGDEAQSMFGDNQLLFDKQGREFSADTEAAIYMADEAQTLWEEINPGNAINGVVVFDIPKDAKPASLELHDSMFSGGVTVSLAK